MTDDAMLEGWLGTHRDAAAPAPSSAHLDVETLARHATGQLSPAKARAASQHLLACDDGRCVAFVRAQVEDRDAAAQMLYAAGEDGEDVRQRTFQCREALWQLFEQASGEQDIPIDDLVNEAMQAYAQSRGHATGEPQYAPPARASAGYGAPPPQRAAPPPPPPSRASMPPPLRGAPLPAPRGGMDEREGRSPGTVRMPSFAGGAPPPPPPSRAARGGMGGMSAPPPPPRQAPPALQQPPTAQAVRPTPRGQPVAAAMLYLEYQGRMYEVDKDRFLMGRSKTQADLRLDDANVSRQHAMIERVGNAYYVVDLGSTNGVLVSGERVARRALQDGDVIEITTHLIQCSFR